MLLNPYKLYTKNELNKQGYKLALIDNNILNEIHKNIENYIWKENTLEYFIKNKIRPVLCDFIIYEFIKGLETLNPESIEFNDLKAKKKLVSQFLDELNTVWIYNQQEILAFEFFNIHNNTIESAHYSYKIFCDSPITIIKNMELRHCPFYNSKDSPPVSSFVEYYEHLLKDLHELPTYTHSKLITELSEIDRITAIIRHYVPQHDVSNISKNIEDALKNFSFESGKAPMFFIQKDFPHKYEEARDYSESINHTLDRWHLYTSLSYCDYFITTDEKMKNRYGEYTKLINEKLYSHGFKT